MDGRSNYSLFTGLNLVFLGLSVPAFGQDLPDTPRGTKLPDLPVTVPMELHGVYPVVTASVNGQGSYRFLVDTGAAGCGRINALPAERLKLKEVGEVITGDPSGRHEETAKRVGVESISLGGAVFSDLAMLRHDNRGIMDQGREGIDGILGFGLFHDCLVTFDYPNRKLIIEHGVLPVPDGRSIFAFRSPHGIPEIPLRIGELEVDADIDSGSMGSVSIPQTVASKLKFNSDPVVVGKASTGLNEFEIREATLDGAVQLGTYVIPNPVVAVYDIFPRANIGGQFLQEFSIALDQRNQRVRFRRDGDQPIAIRPRVRVGVMMKPAAGGLKVDSIVPRSPAEKAGILPGDIIARVNGACAEELGLEGVRQLFSTPNPIKLSVDRMGEQLELTVTPSAD